MDPINLRILFISGSEEVVSALAVDLMAFEAKFDMSATVLGKDVRLTHLFFLAWHASKRTGKTSAEFEKWAEDISIVTGDEVKK